MTESSEQVTATRGSRARLIKNPGAAPRIDVLISFAEYRFPFEPPSVMARCGPCEKRLFDLAVGLRFDVDLGVIEDDTLVVSRKCPKCGVINKGRVTASGGHPYAGQDALAGPWRCDHCDQSLGKIEPVRGRIITTCDRCRHECRIIAAKAVRVIGGTNT